MKNNYDLILNFEKKDGEPLTDNDVDSIFNYASSMVSDIINDDEVDIRVWKAIISQAVESRRVS